MINTPSSVLKDELIAMAADPEIQAELRELECEFSVTDADGLDSES